MSYKDAEDLMRTLREKKDHFHRNDEFEGGEEIYVRLVRNVEALLFTKPDLMKKALF
jgi:hypothetical protein